MTFWVYSENSNPNLNQCGYTLTDFDVQQLAEKYPDFIYFEDESVILPEERIGPRTFRQDLEHLLNYHSIDAKVGMHDFNLAAFLENVIVDLTHANRTERRLKEKSEEELSKKDQLLLNLGFCPEDLEPMPCTTCGAGL